MTPLRVGHVVGSLDPAAGGPPVVAAMLAAALSAAGHPAGLAVPAPSPVPDGLGVPATRLPAVGWAAALLGRGPAFAAWADWVAGHDLLHLHGVWEPALVLAGRLARRIGRPYVVTPHGMLDPWSLGQKRWKKRLALRLVHRRLLGRAAAVHYLNADEAALAAPLGLTAPGVVVPNGLRPPDPLPDPGRFRAARPELGADPYILFLSRLHPKKGLDVLADAFAAVADRHPTVRLVVAGPEDGAGAAFADQIKRLAIAGRVHRVGPLYGTDKWAALAGAAAFCLPSRQEGFSLAILEALGAGRPVVVTEGCHFPEVQAMGAGRVVALDAGAVAAALLGVLADPAAADRMGTAGRRLVGERFTWPAVAAQMAGVYAACRAGGPGGG